MNPKPLSNAKDEDARLVEQALRRAAQNARLLAARTNTAYVVFKEGSLHTEKVSISEDITW